MKIFNGRWYVLTKAERIPSRHQYDKAQWENEFYWKDTGKQA